LNFTGKVELSGFSIEVEIRPVECNEFTDAEASICEENDKRLIPILEIGRERLREARIAKSRQLD
jgi:hypothetical protein